MEKYQILNNNSNDKVDKYVFKIEEIELNNGQTFVPKKLNIIVGANNVGKSRFLKDIEEMLTNNNAAEIKNVVIKKMKYLLPRNNQDFWLDYNLDDKILKSFDGFFMKSYYGVKNLNSEQSLASSFTFYPQIINGYELLKYLTKEKNIDVKKIEENNKKFISIFGKLFVFYLGTEEKLMLCKKQTNFGVYDRNTNFLSTIRNNTDALKKLSVHTLKMFNKDIILDNSTMGAQLAFRVGNDFSYYRNIQKNNMNMEKQLANENLLDDEGDGLKSFVSTFMALSDDEKSIFLIDEPESFLHPPLARKMGEIIAKFANKDKQIFISTHSEDILNGIISKAKIPDLNIIRINKDKNLNSMKIIDKEDIQKIVNEPLLIASDIFKGIFCEKVYITESFSDTMLYQKIKSKVDEFSSYYFVNTQGKDSIGKVTQFYDKLGVDNTAIFDFDYFRNLNTIKATLYKKIGNCCDYDKVIIFSRRLKDYIEKSAQKKVKNLDISSDEKKKQINLEKQKMYHEEGINCITSDDELKQDGEKVINILRNNNIIVLKNGCLETTLKDLKIEFSNNKKDWLKRAIDAVENESIDTIENSDIYKYLFNK